jgi:hypothetical protein
MGGEGGCEKEYSLYACDNDEKDDRGFLRKIQKMHLSPHKVRQPAIAKPRVKNTAC